MTEPNAPEITSTATAGLLSTPTGKRRFGKTVLAGVAATIVLAAGVFGAAAYADKGGRHGDRMGGPMGGFMIERMLDRVDATEEQRTRIKAIMDRTKEQMTDLRAERKAVMEDVTTILKAPTVDRAAIEAKRTERLAKVDAASKQMTAAFADVAEVLSPEQRKIVAALLEDRMERGGKRRGKMQRGSLDGTEAGQPAVVPTAN